MVVLCSVQPKAAGEEGWLGLVLGYTDFLFCNAIGVDHKESKIG